MKNCYRGEELLEKGSFSKLSKGTFRRISERMSRLFGKINSMLLFKWNFLAFKRKQFNSSRFGSTVIRVYTVYIE